MNMPARILQNLLIFISVVASIIGCNNSTGLGPGIPGDEPEMPSWTPMSDMDTIDSYIRRDSLIYCGDSEHPWAIIEEADANSFEVSPGSHYARDSNHVYYPIETTCLPDDTATVCFCREYIVEGAVPDNFRYLGNGYGTDGLEVYYRGEVHQGLSGEDF